MSIKKIPTLRGSTQFGALAMLMFAGAGKAWAQTCNYDITTVAVPAPANVPSLSMLGVALLAAAVGFLAWRQGKFPGARFMAIVLVAAAAMLANQGGGGLVQRAYAAVVEVILSNPAGENIAASANDGDEVTFRNTSGVPLRIGSITPAPTACGEGTVIPPGGTCTTTAVCAPIQGCEANEVPNPSSPTGCACQANYARSPMATCIPVFLCDNGAAFNGYEQVCNP